MDSGMTYEERYPRDRINFFHTTETQTYPVLVLPTLLDLTIQNTRNPRVLSITSAGQILDYVASLDGRVISVDLIDHNPCQNLYVASTLASVLRYENPEQLRNYVLTRNRHEVMDDFHVAMDFFNKLSGYPDTYDLELERLAYSLECRELPGEDIFTQEHLTPYNYRYLFLIHIPWYRSLRKSVMDGVFRFHCGGIEYFDPEDGNKDIVYLSDVHPWTDPQKLAANLLNLVSVNGWFLSAFFGSDCLGFVYHGIRDSEFKHVVEGLGVFNTESAFTRRSGKVKRQVRKMLGVNASAWEGFFEDSLGFPHKQQLPFIGRRKC